MYTECPNCNATMDDGETCPECDHDDRGGEDCTCRYCEHSRESSPPDPTDAELRDWEECDRADKQRKEQ